MIVSVNMHYGKSGGCGGLRESTVGSIRRLGASTKD